jgi:hypothetical protein
VDCEDKRALLVAGLMTVCVPVCTLDDITVCPLKIMMIVCVSLQGLADQAFSKLKLLVPARLFGGAPSTDAGDSNIYTQT